MSDTTDATTEPETGTTAATPASTARSIEGFSPDAQDYIKRLRDEASTRRKREKELEAELEQRDQAGKTEQQWKDEALAAAQAESAAATTKLLAFEVAAEKNLPSKWATRLRGTTREELEKDAETLAKELGGEGSSEAPSFDGGPRRTQTTKPKTMNGVIAAARRGR